MAKGKELKTFAYEEFMARARKEGRVRNETLSMKVLKPDLSLQARVNHLDVDHVRALHDILKGGQQLAPIIVFEIEELKGKTTVTTFKIADGFHRHEVYKREKAPGIPCIVVAGTLQEAIEYAASANQSLSLKRTREDIRKAVFMLLDNGWLAKSAAQVSRQSGASPGAVARYIAEYRESRSLPPPAVTIDKNGLRKRIRGGNQEAAGFSSVVTTYGPKYQAYIGGERIQLGRNRHLAKDRLAAIEAGNVDGPVHLSAKTDLPVSLARRGLSCKRAGEFDTTFHQVPGYVVRDTVVVVLPSAGTPDFIKSCSSVFFAREALGLARAVVLANAGRASHPLDTVAVKLGVEFMTLDQFVAAMKADGGDMATAV